MSRGKHKLTRDEQEEIDLMDMRKSAAGLEDLKINLKCKTEGQKLLVNSIKSKEVTICSGLAGTGKTRAACQRLRVGCTVSKDTLGCPW